MKHGFARTMGFLMAAALLLAMVLPAQAATTGKSGRFSYSMKGNGTLKITAFDWDGYEDDTDIVIPQMIDGFTMTEIGSLAFSQGDMDYERIELPYAQKDAENATLIIPNTVTSVGDKAFFNSSIGIVNIPASVESIGVAAFCTMKLKRVTVDSANKNYASIDGSLYCKKDRELLALGKETSKVPDGIICLGEFSCTTRNAYASIWIEKILPCSTIETIKEFALFDMRIFYQGEFLEADVWRYGYRLLDFLNVRTIGDYAFAKCRGEGDRGTSLRFSNRLEKLGKGCFYYTDGDWNYLMNECTKLTQIPEKTFSTESIYGSDYISVYLPDTIEEIRDEAFKNAKLSVLRINGTRLKSIGNGAFYNATINVWNKDDIYNKGYWTRLDSFLSNVESIGSEAFLEVDDIETVMIPESCVYIGDNAFDKVSVKLKVQPGSYAERWAQDNGYTYDNGIKADTSWLN